MSLHIDIARPAASPRTAEVSLSGRLDAASAPQLEEALAPLLDRVQHLVFDLANLTFLSSAGVRAIAVASRRMNERDGTFAMKNLQPQIQKVFEIIGALPGVTIFRSQEELDSYLAAIQRKITG